MKKRSLNACISGSFMVKYFFGNRLALGVKHRAVRPREVKKNEQV